MENKLKDAEKAVVDARNADRFKRGLRSRYFSVEGGLRMAALKVCSNSPAYSLGVALRIDVHRRTVIRKEKMLRAARIAAFRSWICKSYNDILEPVPLRGLRMALIRVRCDASRINLYRKSKLNVTEV